MKLAVIGLGYVGVTSLACFAKMGHSVIGCEVNEEKVRGLERGHAGIVEPNIESLLVTNRDLCTFQREINTSLNTCDLIFICVGTPTKSNGTSDLTALMRVCEALDENKIEIPIVLRSTIPVGTTTFLSSKYPKLTFVFHPEFLREGTAVDDFFNPPKIVFGVQNKSSTKALLKNLYKNISASKFFVDYETAETVKYADNIFHALKVTFTNEITRSCASKNADSNKVMEIFCSDRQLNLSSYYLKPGFAYGGSCLDKDLLSFLNQNKSIELPLLEHIQKSNQSVIDSVFNKLKQKDEVFVIDGLTFKEDIDDLRRSPFVKLAEQLLECGKTIYAYDRNLEKLYGESSEIKNRLLQKSNFKLNFNGVIECGVVVLRAHKKTHLQQPVSILEEYKLYPNPTVQNIYQ